MQEQREKAGDSYHIICCHPLSSQGIGGINDPVLHTSHEAPGSCQTTCLNYSVVTKFSNAVQITKEMELYIYAQSILPGVIYMLRASRWELYICSEHLAGSYIYAQSILLGVKPKTPLA